MAAHDEDGPISTIPEIRVHRVVGDLKPKQVVSYTHFEEILSRINPFGAYQIFTCFCILFGTVEWTGNYTFASLLGSIEPAWECRMHDGTIVNVSAPTDDAKCKFLKTNCTSWTAIKSSTEFYSLVAAWRLVCDDKDKTKYIRLVQHLSSFLGAFVGGHVGDHFGRKTFFFTGELCILISSVITTAAVSWYTYAICQFINGLIYGWIEVTSLTLMMEYTNNKFRMIPNACFQKCLAYLVMALIAFLTKDWQYSLIFLNLISSPVAIAFRLFHESPRWLVATDQLEKACEVLNDIAHRRWNHANVKFTTQDLNLIPRDNKKKAHFYNFFHMFSSKRLVKQSVMQVLSMFTCATVSGTYLFSVKGMHNSAIVFTFLDGVFRIFVPALVIFLDFKFFKFGRRMQFIGSLTLICLCLGAVIALIAVGFEYTHISITTMVIIATMINDGALWINIVQNTTQRYPTVIRCVAFGTIQSVRHLGFAVDLFAFEPMVESHPLWAFIFPEILVVVTLAFGLFLQAETKGKPLMERLVEGHYGRFENEIPKALMRMAAGHRFNQAAVRDRLNEQYRERRNAELRATESSCGEDTRSISST